MCERSPTRPSETSSAAVATPRSATPSAIRGVGVSSLARAAASASGSSAVRPVSAATRERRVAEHARHVDVVAHPRARAQQRAAGRHLAHDRHAKRERAARRVAADEVDAVGVRERVEAARERREPGGVAVGQRAGEQRPFRRRAHRRHVGKVHRERLVAEVFRVGVGEEMAPAHQHVDRHRELAGRRRREERRIVADGRGAPRPRAPAA